MIPRLRWLLLAILLTLAPTHAWAHAQLLSTTPTENAVLEAAPAQLTLTFNEPVSPLAMKLIGADGASSDIAATAAGNEVHVSMPAGAANGTHVLSYRVVSTDGHPIGGSLVFSIGQVTGAAETAATDPAVAVALWAGKALLFVCLFAGIGGVVFASLAALPLPARTAALALSLAGAIVAPATLGLQGLDALGMRLPSFFDGKAWSAGLSTCYGFTAIVGGIAFLVAIVSLAIDRSRSSIVLGLVAGVLAAGSLALSGHASAASPQWLTRPAVFLHIGGVLFWVGALFPLWLLLRDRSAASASALASFSTGIPYAVAPLVLSGITLAVIQMSLPGPQWLTPYGFILVAKLCLLAVLFGLAVWNRRWLTKPALAGDAGALSRLRGSIGLEVVLIVIILGLVAGWRFTPPPRALALAPVEVVAAEPLMLHIMDAKTMAMVMVTPGSAGLVALRIDLTDIVGSPKDAQSIAVTISSPSLGIEPIKRDAMPVADGWEVQGLTIPLAGTWSLSVDVRISRFELINLQTEFDL